MSYRYIHLEQQGAVATLTLQRPEAANALNQLLAEEITQALGQLVHVSDVRVLVITGAGTRVFCAGADLKERHGMTEHQWHAQHHALEQAVQSILSFPKPVIAALNGAAFGGGLELAMACDFMYAADTAVMALSEARLGIMCGMGGTQLLPRRVGIARAKEILFSARPISAQEAFNIGLVNSLFPVDILLAESKAKAALIATNAPLALLAIKRAVNEGAHQALVDAMKIELHYYNNLLNTSDRHEGINAFNEKRQPLFTGN